MIGKAAYCVWSAEELDAKLAKYTAEIYFVVYSQYGNMDVESFVKAYHAVRAAETRKTCGQGGAYHAVRNPIDPNGTPGYNGVHNCESCNMTMNDHGNRFVCECMMCNYGICDSCAGSKSYHYPAAEAFEMKQILAFMIGAQKYATQSHYDKWLQLKPMMCSLPSDSTTRQLYILLLAYFTSPSSGQITKTMESRLSGYAKGEIEGFFNENFTEPAIEGIFEDAFGEEMAGGLTQFVMMSI